MEDESMMEPVDPMVYYKRILAAARQLATSDGDDPMTGIDDDEGTEDSYLDQIATALVAACNVLHHDATGLPKILEEHPDAYVYRRIDYLRRLLRACAPIAMEIVARTVALPGSYLLHCFWVPLAPQIFPGVWAAIQNGDCPVVAEPQTNVARLVLLLEATFHLAQYVAVELNQEDRLAALWDWNWLFRLVRHQDQFGEQYRPAVHFYVQRVLAYTHRMGLVYLQEQKVDSLIQDFFQHPWDIRQEAAMYEQLILFHQSVVIWDSDDLIPIPNVASCHSTLVMMEGFRFWKHTRETTSVVPSLVMTDTTKSNLRILATALAQQQYPGILISSHTHLLHYMAAVLNIPVLELFLDETTDIPSTLYGSTVPANGTFAWQWGVIATALKKGHWVILHGMTMDWQAALELVVRDGILTHSTKPSIRANFSFRLFGVVNAKDRLLSRESWYRADAMQDPPKEECLAIARHLFQNIPESILDATVQVTPSNVGLRHFLKLLKRIQQCVPSSGQYITEQQRLLCAAECLDVYGMSEPNPSIRHQWLEATVAPAFGVAADLVVQFTERRSEPSRITFPSDRVFNGSTMRLLERLAVCVREQEPVLLVGETGTGKTTTIQMLAKMLDRPLIVQNVSLQTDSTDLLGGYKPVELKHVGRKMYEDFVDLFTATFSRKQNAKFLTFAAQSYEQADWKKLSQCCRKAAELGLAKVDGGDVSEISVWRHFQQSALMFEQHRTASGPVFEFVEGALVDAIRNGKWVLLDEINLASSETLQRLCGLLNDAKSSLTITERGDLAAIERHPSFRIFAAMNPATDVGKKELAPRIRTCFTELYVDEILNPLELREIVAEYLQGVLDVSKRPAVQSESVIAVVETYLKCRELSDRTLADGGGQKPRYTLRTLTRAVTATRKLVLEQKFALQRALVEGFLLAFQGPLDSSSFRELERCVHKNLGKTLDKRQIDQPSRRPGGRGGGNFVLIAPFWIQQGDTECMDMATQPKSRFVLVQSTQLNLRRLARALAAGKSPILLEGPTSAGKTSLVEYVAARCGHKVVRINNHEHTDVQEYVGGFTPDSNGCLSFHDGVLVSAMRKGHWVILDELNLAPSDVLEALNRLLDDNRELYISETNEVVKPHTNFQLFATQNPSGSYGGRKPLSRAFRNRFVEIQINGIPTNELVSILSQRCGCPQSHASLLVDVMRTLRQQRSQGSVFLGKEGFITPRDLLRWASREAATKRELAEQGFMILAERLRSDEEKVCVLHAIEQHFKLTLDITTLYYGPTSKARKFLESQLISGSDFPNLALTKSLLRVVSLMIESSLRREPVLLVGDTGCGKTMAVQLFSKFMQQSLCILNCHQTTETSDLIGGLRPTRGRALIKEKISELFACIAVELESTQLSALLTGITERLHDFLEADDALSKLRAVRHEIETTIVDTGCDEDQPSPKRRRLEVKRLNLERRELIANLFDKTEEQLEKYHSLFEWEDGPLVLAMRNGHALLLDELSLADDAVLERLNPVLEPSRTIILAEQNTKNCGDRKVTAHEEFQVFATMNPGGDYGKRELSPALRSRFTEIWVPPIDDFSDIGLVLRQSLRLCPLIPCSVDLHPLMIEYVKWFNDTICNHVSISSRSLELSIRDLLTWAKFVIDCRKRNDSITLFVAYIHGARLMHLDGLGLGMGISSDETKGLKGAAEAFLRSQLQANGFCLEAPILEFHQDNGFFGCRPFLIDSKNSSMDNDFQVHAPTTAQNVYRTLRAMQVRKPILLEGPPGVGKTTLVESLAKCVGRNLVRINLSEQTEISDLIGSDLPVASSSSSAEFMWFDGVLLTAIKRGDWVLLDELNLASQAVLEGLNSCLDHRAEVYVPDIGLTFKCPPGFRIFAAQNPLGQGGGRKGLPKSFLNRFSKVFVEPLNDHDYRHILSSRFPAIQNPEKLISFNVRLSKEAESNTSFAKSGAPWEFNLRDIFRFCTLKSTRRLDDGTIVKYLYMLRLRSQTDRKVALLLHEEIFGSGTFKKAIEDDILFQSQPGPRNKVHVCPVRRNDCFLSTHTCLQAIQECIAMNWPCLLTGTASANILACVRSLAIAGGAPLKEISMTSSSDVSELIGSYDHVDIFTDFRKVTDALLANITPHDLSQNESLQNKAFAVKRYDPCTLFELNRGINECEQLVDLLVGMTSESSALQNLNKVRTALGRISRSAETKASSFVWTDGPLVSAMQRGGWLHLSNVNLCSSSVLDRLNSVMEPNGSLLLAEAGVDETIDGVHRKIHCHPNFRLFLSMDPSYGEVSRAMRNRCVELSFDSKPWEKASGAAYQLDEISQSGVFTLMCAKAILQTDPSSDTIAHAASCVIALAQRGSSPFPMIQQLTEVEVLPSSVSVGDDSLLFSTGAVRSLNLLACISSNEAWELVQQTASFASLQVEQQGGLMDDADASAKLDRQLFRSQLAYRAAKKINSPGILPVSAGNSLFKDKCNLDILIKLFTDGNTSFCPQDAYHVFREHTWTKQQRRTGLSQQTSQVKNLFEASFEWLNGQIRGDSSEPKNAIVSLIYPFFEALDLWLSGRYEVEADARRVHIIVRQRNLFWDLATETPLSAFCTPNSFPLMVLIAQWEEFVSSFGAVSSPHNYGTELVGFVDSISQELLQRRQAFPSTKSLLKYMPFPALPRTRVRWDVLLQLKQITETFVPQVSTTSLELSVMVENKEYCLADVDDLKKEALAMMSTLCAGTLMSEKEGEYVDSTIARVSATLNNNIKTRVRNFYTKVKEAEVDLTSSVSDDMVEGEALERHSALQLEFISNFAVLSSKLLDKMAGIQLAILVEDYMEQVEMDVLDTLYGFVNKNTPLEAFHILHSKICSLISVGVEKSFWTIAEISLYQVLVWLIELKSNDIDEIMSCLHRILPLLSANAARRSTRSARTLLESMPYELQVPLMMDGSPETKLNLSRRVLTKSKTSTAFTLSLLQSGFYISRYVNKSGYSFLTIENASARFRQGCQFVSIMALLNRRGDSRMIGCNEVVAEFNDVTRVAATLSSQGSRTKAKEADTINALSTFIGSDAANKIVPPLVASLASIQENRFDNKAGELARAYVLIGLLQLHLFVPDSPLDPGSRPQAMMAIISKRLKEIYHCLHCEAFDSVWSKGVELECSEQTDVLLSEAGDLQCQFEDEKSNAIERPLVLKPFRDVFDELRQFIESHGSVSTVLGLLAGLSDHFVGNDDVLENWFRTIDAFCNRISGHTYAAYDDVLCRIIGALGKIRKGLDLQKLNKMTSSRKRTLPVRFPLLTRDSSRCDLIALAGTSCDNVFCRQSLALASLHRLVLERKVYGIEKNAVDSWERAMDLVFSGDNVAIQDDLHFLDNVNDSDDDVDDAVERHFPDHGAEYETLAARNDDDISSFVDDRMDDETANVDKKINMNFADVVCELHELFFTQAELGSEFRLQLFMRYFDSACALHNEGGNIEVMMDAATASLAFAMMVASNPTSQSQLSTDFYNDPNVAESLKASQPLSELKAKTMYLLKVFPGNEVLGAVARIADKVLQVDLRLAPFGKVMSGIEVLLRHAQDWEQHASSRIQLSQPLQTLQKIAITWRKLEISFWESSLQSREQRFSKRAKEKWYHLYSFLRSVVASAEKNRYFSLCGESAPSWVWRSFPESSACSVYHYDDELIFSLTKALDTFCLTASIGEFKTRLSMLQTFACQYQSSGMDGITAAIGRSLRSIYDYYQQFWPKIRDHLASLKQNLEKELKSEVKLAKWDCQTYFAMAQSSERNRKKVVRILGQYDSLLRENITSIVVRDLCVGVRADPDRKGDALTAVPRTDVMFPLCVDSVVPEASMEDHSPKGTWEWKDAAMIDLPGIADSKNIRQYAQKMKRLATNAPLGSQGAIEASELCNSILSRIDSLRSLNAPRQMKERALSDLFRVLKAQGYSQTRAGVPREIMNMSDLFQIPCLDKGNALDKKLLVSADSYFKRCLAETHRFELEVQMIGSDHMTKRQLEAMLVVCHQGLHLLCQQRSVLAECMCYRKRLQTNLQTALSMAQNNEPMKFHKAFVEFSRHCSMVLEHLRQACIYLHKLEPVAEGNLELHRAGACRLSDATSDLESLLAKSSANRSSSWFFIDHMIAIRDKLLNVREILVDLQQTLIHIPTSPLSSCMDQIDESTRIASEVDEVFAGSKCGDIDIIHEDFRSSISLAVKTALLAFQGLSQTAGSRCKDDSSVWSYHEESTLALMKCGLKRMDEAFEGLSRQMEKIDTSASTTCLSLYLDTGMLFVETMMHIESAISNYTSFYRNMGKLSYILVRIFRVLAASGFCSQKEDESEAEKDASDMTFDEPAEGTGMGEGEGGNDVTDQIENEEQLLGLKDEHDEQNQESEENPKLDEEEAENGMEMEGDFEGSLYDVPDKDPDPTNDDSGDEEVERDMGDEGKEGNEVIDERLWNESDDENEDNNEDNPIEKDSNVKGDGSMEEMTTNDSEDTGQPQGPENEEDNTNADGHEENTEDHSDDIAEETFEEKHNVDVANQKQETDQPNEEENDLNLDDNLSMDGSKDPDETNEFDAEEDETVSVSSEMETDPKMDETDPIDYSDEAEDEEKDEVDATIQAAGEDDEGIDQEKASQSVDERPITTTDPQKGLGTQASEGKDSLIGTLEEETSYDGGEAEGEAGTGHDELDVDDSASPQGNTTSNNGSSAVGNRGGAPEKTSSMDSVPNPFSSPGDVSEFWHKKLNMLEREDEAEDGEKLSNKENDDSSRKGDFDFAREDELFTSQVLGPVEEEKAMEVEDMPPEQEVDIDDGRVEGRKKPPPTNANSGCEKESTMNSKADKEERNFASITDEEVDESDEEGFSSTEASIHNAIAVETLAVANLEQLKLIENEEAASTLKYTQSEDEMCVAEAEMEESRRQWSEIQGETSQLSRRLCEKLRLVIEPLLASKLRGDYRTGKRINMKRVIGYIASGYQKDKIWLRRTKPAKRDYRVLLAVDDSQSMSKSGAGSMALRALSTLLVGMSQLEIGEVGVASFGNEMRLLLPFQEFFTPANGASIVQHFKFDQARTRIAFCLESACEVLDSELSQSMQIMFIVSDGRIERDSRSAIRRLIREMMERNILLVLIIVESGTEDSIMNMKEVSFEKGKPVVRDFMEDYPFPYYILLSNMERLPEVLGDALRQWFELLARTA